jgi:hypothetical protein
MGFCDGKPMPPWPKDMHPWIRRGRRYIRPTKESDERRRKEIEENENRKTQERRD